MSREQLHSLGAGRRRLRRSTLVAFVAILLAVGLVRAPAGVAGEVAHTDVVSANPADNTPAVLDGQVNAVVQLGNTVVVGGTFTQVKSAGASQPTLPRNRLFSFNATTGQVDPAFTPQPDGEVSALIPGPDGSSVIAGGRFNHVKGAVADRVARINLSNGGLTAGFTPPTVDGPVDDLAWLKGQVLAAGAFSKVNGAVRTGLATIAPDSGALTDTVNLTITEPRAGPTISVDKVAVSPNEQRAVIIGNFSRVNGNSHPQIAVLRTSQATATVADWSTPFFDVSTCSSSFLTYMRDVDIDPVGSYFVVGTTGAYYGPDSPCDVAARFELYAKGTVQPTWRAYTGGDTITSIQVTGAAVYAGGHFRWLNNPAAADAAGPGAVPRPGIAALDPRNGLPYRWNPGRDRGVGVWALTPTTAGVWVGSDTDTIGGEDHPKLAFMPRAGGSATPADKSGLLPADIVRVGAWANDGSGPTNVVTSRYFDGSNPPGAETAVPTGEYWTSARGSVLIDDTLYASWSNGKLTKRSFDGQQFGAPTTLDLYGGSFAADAPHVTGMAYSRLDARLYYTLSGSTDLHWRAFTPESGVIGQSRFKAGGNVTALDPSRVRGMFLSGDRLYFADRTDGALRSVGLSDGSVSGPAAMADSSADWRASGLAIRGGDASQPDPLLPQPPPVEPIDPAPAPSSPQPTANPAAPSTPTAPSPGGGLPSQSATLTQSQLRVTRMDSELEAKVVPAGAWRVALDRRKGGRWSAQKVVTTNGSGVARFNPGKAGQFRVRVLDRAGFKVAPAQELTWRTKTSLRAKKVGQRVKIRLGRCWSTPKPWRMTLQRMKGKSWRATSAKVKKAKVKATRYRVRVNGSGRYRIATPAQNGCDAARSKPVRFS